MQLYFCDTIAGNFAQFDEQESHHLHKVLRKKEGDLVSFTDGKGMLFHGKIEGFTKNRCIVQITDKCQEIQSKGQVCIAIAPTKQIDRFEWFVEKSVEIGVDTIIPIYCKRSERKQVNTDRLQKIALSAMKQSGRFFLPEIAPLTTFKEAIKQSFNGVKALAHCNETEKQPLSSVWKKENDIIIFIGPEGDFSDEEITLAKSQGYQFVILGDNRLRTETAGIVACHTIQVLKGI